MGMLFGATGIVLAVLWVAVVVLAKLNTMGPFDASLRGLINHKKARVRFTAGGALAAYFVLVALTLVAIRWFAGWPIP